eukprot:5096166-Alexandrium_andersonii.AAC.1
MLGDSLTKPGYPARHVMERFLTVKRWKCTYDETFESAKRRRARGVDALADTDPSRALTRDPDLSEAAADIYRDKYELLS